MSLVPHEEIIRAESPKRLTLATVISASGKITVISALNYRTCKLDKIKRSNSSEFIIIIKKVL